MDATLIDVDQAVDHIRFDDGGKKDQEGKTVGRGVILEEAHCAYINLALQDDAAFLHLFQNIKRRFALTVDVMNEIVFNEINELATLSGPGNIKFG